MRSAHRGRLSPGKRDRGPAAGDGDLFAVARRWPRRRYRLSRASVRPCQLERRAGDATERLVREALHAALRPDVEGVLLDAALWREVITRVMEDNGAVQALGKFARGIVSKRREEKGVPVSVTLTLMYKMRWHARVVLRRMAEPAGPETEGKRRLDDLDRIERFLRRLDGDALDTVHGFGRVEPDAGSPCRLYGVAELRALFQRYGAASPELRAQLGTTRRTGGGITKREIEIAKQAAISAFAAAMFDLSGVHRDVLVSQLAGAAFDDRSVSDRDVRRLHSSFLDKLGKRP